MNQTAQVIKAEDFQIIEFNEFESKLADFKAKYDGIVYDLTDDAQEKQARSDRLSIGKVVSKLDSTHKDLKAPLKAKTDLIDAERKRIKDDLLAVQDKIKGQIAEHERKIQEHAEMLQGKVDEIENLGVFDELFKYSSTDIKLRFNIADGIDVDDSYEHRKADATLAKIDVIKKLESLFAAAQESEAEQAELDRLRKEAAAREQADREQKIADDAAKAATARALAAEQAVERAEQEKVEAAAKAVRDQEEAEQRAIRAADQAKQDQIDAVERERKAAEQREQARISAELAAKAEEAAEAKRREKNRTHRASINNAAVQCFVDGGLTKVAATAAVKLIAQKKIDSVTISY